MKSKWGGGGGRGGVAPYGHMVQNPSCWRASYALGYTKQSDFIQSFAHNSDSITIFAF